MQRFNAWNSAGCIVHSAVAMIEFGHMPPVPIAEASVIVKTALLATDYHDVVFLVKVSSLESATHK